MKKPIAALLLSAFALAACSGLAGPIALQTPAPTLTFTPFPTLTAALALTETPDAISAIAPEGEPASEWQGIPIMPGAIAGEGDEESYVFSIQATTQEVQEYYKLELGKLGWQLLSQGKGETSALLLIFTNDAAATLTVSILVKGDKSLVLLVK